MSTPPASAAEAGGATSTAALAAPAAAAAAALAEAAPPAAAPSPAPSPAIHKTTDKALLLEPRVGCTAPARLHVLKRDAATGVLPSCDCGRGHVELGQTYAYCTCGLSADKGIFCDGACEGTRFKPEPFTIHKDQSFYLICRCKRTSKPPVCDGAHIHLTWKDLEW